MTVHYVKKVLKIIILKDIVSFTYFSITIKLKTVTTIYNDIGCNN